MKKTATLFWLAAALSLGLSACATQPAPDVAGRWKPVNRYAQAPQEIPLQQNYVFFVSPLDGTLKNALARWAKDSKMTLSYLHASDFTLHTPVASIRTNSLQDALSQITAAYAPQQVQVVAEQNQIVVRYVDHTRSEAGANTPSP